MLLGSIVIIVLMNASVFFALRIPTLKLYDESTREEKLASIDQWLSHLHRAGKFNGTVLLAKNGEVIFENHYGWIDYQGTEQINNHSAFNLASVSKHFTAMGIVLLKNQALLDYDDLLGKHIPELDFYQGVTLRHLLHHTSGIPDYMKLVMKHKDTDELLTTGGMVKLFVDLKPDLNFESGAKFQYSNTGYVLLSEVIERVSGQTFAEFMSKRIFVPLGMNDTQVFNLTSEQQPAHRVYGIASKLWLFGGQKVEKDLNFFDGVAGDGGIYASAKDLAIWDKALNEGKLVTNESYEVAYESGKLLNGNDTYYGFGWFLNEDGSVEHAGGWRGFSSYLFRDIASKDLIVILDNSSNALRVNAMGFRFNSIGLNLKGALKKL